MEDNVVHIAFGLVLTFGYTPLYGVSRRGQANARRIRPGKRTRLASRANYLLLQSYLVGAATRETLTDLSAEGRNAVQLRKGLLIFQRGQARSTPKARYVHKSQSFRLRLSPHEMERVQIEAAERGDDLISAVGREAIKEYLHREIRRFQRELHKPEVAWDKAMALRERIIQQAGGISRQR